MVDHLRKVVTEDPDRVWVVGRRLQTQVVQRRQLRQARQHLKRSREKTYSMFSHHLGHISKLFQTANLLPITAFQVK